ncbi:hypothetical protein HMN09_01392700 [Mycena chlorophos]|uniref:F-box domain-containing protein n=1 Tax=Mycena chlorophos TaxID=658473 RepID=A0A8H6RY32_MYCCL|nr:hypothetical protein HMN09_01392700 [Mycena chlorophos]
MPRELDLPFGLATQHDPINGTQRASLVDLLRCGENDEEILAYEVDEMTQSLWEAQQMLSHQRRENELVASLLAPIRRIPPEVLGCIFEECVAISLSDDGYVITDVRCAPFLLTQVCSSWRALARSTPRLWTHLVLDLQTSKMYKYDVQSLWRLSAACPIHLTISQPIQSWNRSDFTFGSTRPATLLPLLIQHPDNVWSRLETLVLSIGLVYSDEGFSLVPGWPVLRHLKLDFRGGGHGVLQAARILELFHNSPKLTDVNLILTETRPTLHFPTYAGRHGLPWKNVLNLRLTLPPSAEQSIPIALDILGACSSLIDCTLDRIQTPSRPPPVEPPIVYLPKLRALAIAGSSTTEIFRYLQVPELVALSVNPNRLDVAAFLDMHGRSDGFKLRCLELLQCDNVGLTAALTIFTASPGIERLRLISMYDGALLDRLAPPPPSTGSADSTAQEAPGLLPKLGKLFISTSKEHSMVMALRRLLSHRHGHGPGVVPTQPIALHLELIDGTNLKRAPRVWKGSSQSFIQQQEIFPDRYS